MDEINELRKLSKHGFTKIARYRSTVQQLKKSSSSSNTVQSSDFSIIAQLPILDVTTKVQTNIYRCKSKTFWCTIMGYCSSVPLAWKHPGRYYPPMVVEDFSISLYFLGRMNACMLKFWHMGQGIRLYDL